VATPLRVMSHVDPNPPLRKLSVEELRTCPGNEHLTDEQLEAEANSLLELAIILYKYYQQSEESAEAASLEAIDVGFERIQVEDGIILPAEQTNSP